jgi:hypothetical protein
MNVKSAPVRSWRSFLFAFYAGSPAGQHVGPVALICGSALDFCVVYPAIDACGQGLQLTAVENARAAIDANGSPQTA